MTNKCYYVATPAKVPGYYNMKFTVKPEDATNPFDVGVTEILCITKDRCEEEFAGMQSLGYEMVSEIREALKFLTG